MNEKITEDIVRSHFKGDPLFSTIKWEEQKSFNKRVVSLLSDASKSKNAKGSGRPEFIVSFPSGNFDYLIVIECKADIRQHRSKSLDQPKDYAVDGVLHYAKALSKEFDVIAIAVSGQTNDELRVSHFVYRKDKSSYVERKNDKILLSINDYLTLFDNVQFAENLRNIDIIQKAIELNEDYQAYSISETTRCTMVSAILLALMNEPFRKGYKDQPDSTGIGQAMLVAIESVLKHNKVKGRGEMLGEYRKILNEPLFQQENTKHKKRKTHEDSITVIKGMIDFLNNNVYPLTRMEQSGFDVMGRFYTEFIRYAAGEQAQGLVLTPSHITELSGELAGITSESIIYDPCCGTGGFLIAGMKLMLNQAGSRSEKRETIKNTQLIGVELRPSMYTYACSNMIMRGDGKSNIYCGDCFLLEDTVKEHCPTIAFLNPPYDVGPTGQMRFIKHALDAVAPQNGTVVAIVQMSCGIKKENELIAIKEEILATHRLHAVLSMPNDLFYPVGVVTMVMIFKANEKNAGRKTWFGYFKDDGFEKRKNKGRIDARGQWNTIKGRWIKAYHNNEEISGLSVKKEITASDEWCAEDYMITDYSSLNHALFERKIREHVAFRIQMNIDNKSDTIIGSRVLKKNIVLNTDCWKWFRLDDKRLFEIASSKDSNLLESGQGRVPYISSSQLNNGVSGFVDEPPSHPSNTITVARNGSICSAFYQTVDYCASPDDVRILIPKFPMNRFTGIFLTVLIEMEKFRYAYGRKFGTKRMKETFIKLPVKVNQEPDWEWIENYIKSLPYSDNL